MIDRHYTPRAMACALLPHLRDLLTPGARVLEPCAGQGAVAQPLREAGYRVTTGDLDPAAPVDRRWDYLEAVAMGRVEPFDAVITNPPFSLSGRFATASLQIAPVVALLAPVQHLEEVGQRPAALLRQIARVVVLPRDDFGQPEGGGRNSGAPSFNCAWLIFRRGHSGGAVTTWVSREEYAALQGQTSLLDLFAQWGARVKINP